MEIKKKKKRKEILLGFREILSCMLDKINDANIYIHVLNYTSVLRNQSHICHQLCCSLKLVILLSTAILVFIIIAIQLI